MLRVRKPNRFHGFDYTRDQLYFITSCVQDMECLFGDVNPDTCRMELNECGEIAYRQWYWLEQQYPYVILHAFVVMPNHVHGIIEINRDLLAENEYDLRVRTGRDLSVLSNHIPDPIDALNHNPDLRNSPNHIPDPIDSSNHNPDQRDSPNHIPDPIDVPNKIKNKSLSELIGAYKTTSSKHVHLCQSADGAFPYHSFRWQRSFHDHIIRSQNAYDRITSYIQNNPFNWLKDKFYP